MYLMKTSYWTIKYHTHSGRTQYIGCQKDTLVIYLSDQTLFIAVGQSSPRGFGTFLFSHRKDPEAFKEVRSGAMYVIYWLKERLLLISFTMNAN